ncbi:hypothetical protein EVAR_38296_1 [Eumeta japonica]|uniref:Uncharacterized protein n=1 Tax=Eumeta variegata TaxID=151549 RepID=A0A4C1WAM1_EUMVA|nr:hypothetical protein EVAR_38296_1 [Eumeta japonica]
MQSGCGPRDTGPLINYVGARRPPAPPGPRPAMIKCRNSNYTVFGRDRRDRGRLSPPNAIYSNAKDMRHADIQWHRISKQINGSHQTYPSCMGRLILGPRVAAIMNTCQAARVGERRAKSKANICPSLSSNCLKLRLTVRPGLAPMEYA